MKVSISRWSIRAGCYALSVVFSILVATQANAWTLEEAAKPYSDQELKVICEGYPACFAMRDMSEEFTAKTGIKIKFEIGDMLGHLPTGYDGYADKKRLF